MSPPNGASLADFDRRDIIYHTVADHPLYTSVLTAEKSTSRQPDAPTVPVLVFWHGGGFVTGDRLYEPWFPKWLVELAWSQDAMILSPDYRLLPEANGADILDDMDAFWTWFLIELPKIAQAEVWTLRPDLERVLCAGQSAGGLIAMHSVLDRPDANIKAMLSLYGPLYTDAPALKMSRPRMIAGSWPPPPKQAESLIRSYMAKARGQVRTVGDPLDDWDLTLSIVQQGWLPRLLKKRPDPRLDTAALLRNTTSMPPMWLVHGDKDTLVPPTCSSEFAKQMETRMPDTPVLVSVEPGDHCFDVALGMHEAWIQKGCEFLKNHWDHKKDS